MDTAAALRAALVQQKVWIEHWQADLAAGFKPTKESLHAAIEMIDAALAHHKMRESA